MLFRDSTDALATYEANIRAAGDQYRLHEATPEHLMNGEVKAMHKRLFRHFKALADEALAYLNDQQKDAA